MHFWCWHFSSSWSYSPILNHQKFDLWLVLIIQTRVAPNLPSAIQTHEPLNNVTFECKIQPIAPSWRLSLIPHSKQTCCCQGKPTKYLWYSALQSLPRVSSITHFHTPPSLSPFGKLSLQMALVRRGGGFFVAAFGHEFARTEHHLYKTLITKNLSEEPKMKPLLPFYYDDLMLIQNTLRTRLKMWYNSFTFFDPEENNRLKQAYLEKGLSDGIFSLISYWKRIR